MSIAALPAVPFTGVIIHELSELVVLEDSAFVTLPSDISDHAWDAMLADIDRLGYVLDDSVEYGEDHNDGYGDRIVLLGGDALV